MGGLVVLILVAVIVYIVWRRRWRGAGESKTNLLQKKMTVQSEKCRL